VTIVVIISFYRRERGIFRGSHKKKDIFNKVKSIDIYWVSSSIDTSFVDRWETLNDSRKIKSMYGEDAVRFLEIVQPTDIMQGVNGCQYFEKDTWHIKVNRKDDPEFGNFIINRCIRQGHGSTILSFSDQVADTHSGYNDEMFRILTDISKQYIKEKASLRHK
jgi:hypothetical protein